MIYDKITSREEGDDILLSKVEYDDILENNTIIHRVILIERESDSSNFKT